MNTNWIDNVLHLNTCIVETEESFAAQVATIVAMSAEGHDTAELELRLATHQRRLFLMRRMQTQLLQDPKTQA